MFEFQSISPGAVRTEIMGTSPTFPEGYPALEPEDVSHSILHILGTPPRVQIHELIIKPNGEFL
jgi:NADP+-dependent farnesol dehydrogenase